MKQNKRCVKRSTPKIWRADPTRGICRYSVGQTVNQPRIGADSKPKTERLERSADVWKILPNDFPNGYQLSGFMSKFEHGSTPLLSWFTRTTICPTLFRHVAPCCIDSLPNFFASSGGTSRRYTWTCHVWRTVNIDRTVRITRDFFFNVSKCFVL